MVEWIRFGIRRFGRSSHLGRFGRIRLARMIGTLWFRGHRTMEGDFAVNQPGVIGRAFGGVKLGPDVLLEAGAAFRRRGLVGDDASEVRDVLVEVVRRHRGRFGCCRLLGVLLVRFAMRFLVGRLGFGIHSGELREVSGESIDESLSNLDDVVVRSSRSNLLRMDDLLRFGRR
jgi:hypothetical protein